VEPVDDDDDDGDDDDDDDVNRRRYHIDNRFKIMNHTKMSM